MRSWIGVCAVQEAARAASLENSAAEKGQSGKNGGQKKDKLSSQQFSVSVISETSFPCVERPLTACSLYDGRRHNLRC